MTSEKTRREQVADRILATEGRWVLGRVMPRELLDGIHGYLDRVAPDRADAMIDDIRARADELAAADRDMIVDGPAKGMLALSAVVLAAYEKLRPLFDGDGDRTIRYLRRVLGAVLRRPLEAGVEALGKRDDALDAIDKVCRKDFAMYGSYYDIEFTRPDADTFEMTVGRCFFRDFFDRHGEVPVTTVMCAWDANWMTALDPATSGLRAERPSLMSQGADRCRFRVLRTDDPLAEHADALSP